MTKFFKVIFTTTETVTSSATMEGESAEHVVDALRNQLGGVVDNLTIPEVTELDPIPAEGGKPQLRLVN